MIYRAFFVASASPHDEGGEIPRARFAARSAVNGKMHDTIPPLRETRPV
jgi:hypothetical protein